MPTLSAYALSMTSCKELQRKPMMEVSPICEKNAGLSRSSLELQLPKAHQKLSCGQCNDYGDTRSYRVDSAMTMEIQEAIVTDRRPATETLEPYFGEFDLPRV
ncbi:hypothetical protein V6N13_040450 [Hibiscus sabdariffa]